jgi:hypothetical protein
VVQGGNAVVDKLSRQAHFLSLPPKFDAVDLAHLYLHEVYRHHGLPRVLISYRDVHASLFWTALMKRLGVKLNLSTAYHPQTDGQSKRTIGTLEDVIRPHVCYFQKDWDQCSTKKIKILRIPTRIRFILHALLGMSLINYFIIMGWSSLSSEHKWITV